MSKFVQADRDQPCLLPPDLRDWLPEDDLAHVVLETVERVPLEHFKVNVRGTGSAQYHPRMMLALLMSCYANGHPDHDTLCAFRRQNLSAISERFLQVLLPAKELKLLKVGKVRVDGTEMKASGSKRRSIRYDRARALREQWQGEIEGATGFGL